MAANDRLESVKEHYRNLAPEYGTRANQTCEKSYWHLVRRFLGGRRRLLELGSGSTDLLNRLRSPFAVACDLSWEMLRARPADPAIHCVVSAGERLPFADASFDGVFLINVLEHVASVPDVLGECARVLQDGGVLLAVTPNGDWEYWLDLAERWKLKIPEGPHQFLTRAGLARAVGDRFETLEHRTFLALPAGPRWLAACVDRVTFAATFGWGFFQYLAARKRAPAEAGRAG